MKVFFSPHQDPFFHLGMEDHFLRSYEASEEFLILYQNEPSVVMGRFQNPWIEVDLNWVLENNLHLVRRMSGGGTVYHDLGNVNFAYIGPLSGFKKEKSLKMVQEKLMSFGIHVEINSRFDLVCEGKKISGSAYKQTRDRVLHHFTLLISANLNFLEQSLHSPHKINVSNSIPSVRSKVLNLSTLNHQLNFEELKNQFNAIPLPKIEVDQAWSKIDWLWGETPFFEWNFIMKEVSFFIASRKGKIEKLAHGLNQQLLEDKNLHDDWLSAKQLHQYFYKIYPQISLEDWKKFIGY